MERIIQDSVGLITMVINRGSDNSDGKDIIGSWFIRLSINVIISSISEIAPVVLLLDFISTVSPEDSSLEKSISVRSTTDIQAVT